MTGQAVSEILIRHVSGSKINKIDPFPATTTEITFGRDVGSAITYDSSSDDVVSRRQAVIRVKPDDPPRYFVEDLGSSNGTYVNGERISAQTELFPDDTVEFGLGGPKFIFDVQPRPRNLAARTRIIGARDNIATRIVSTAPPSDKPTAQATIPPPKIGVGKETVMTLLSAERRTTGRAIWKRAAAIVLPFAIVGAAAVGWQYLRTSETRNIVVEHAAATRAIEQQIGSVTQQVGAVAQQMGMSPQEIVSKFGNSVVMVNFRWRLYDKETGRPVFHKTVKYDNEIVPVYVRLANGRIVRWLTNEDELRTNIEIGQAGSGSGFVVAENGFILTNKHVAAGWLSEIDLRSLPKRGGVIYQLNQEGKPATVTRGQRQVRVRPTFAEQVQSLDGADELGSWVPEIDGGLLFANDEGGYPVVIGGGKRIFYGRNDILEVRFPGNALSINATLARSASRGDAALIKIDSPQPLVAVELQKDNTISVGERVIVMGHPGVSTSTTAIFTTSEGGTVRTRSEEVPEPTVTDGIVSKLGMELSQQGTTQIAGRFGDAFQLSVVATGAGNSGGPVFNLNGKVIGLFTYIVNGRDGTRVSLAVPIRHGLDLLQPQRTQ